MVLREENKWFSVFRVMSVWGASVVTMEILFGWSIRSNHSCTTYNNATVVVVIARRVLVLIFLYDMACICVQMCRCAGVHNASYI